MPTIFFYIINLIIFVVAVVFAWVTVSQLRNTSATYNARLLPFAYYSLSCWILWVLQYLVLIARETQQERFLHTSYEIFTPTARWMGIVQTVLLIVAVLSLYSKQPPRLSLTLPSLIAFSVLTAFLCYRTEMFFSPAFFAFEIFLSAIIFVAFVPSILQLRLSKVFAAVFIIYGLSQFLWLLSDSSAKSRAIILLAYPLLRVALLFSWAKMIIMLLQRAQSSYERVIREIESLELLPNPAASFGVMISSTVEDLLQERNATDRAIRALHLDRFRAETFGSLPHAPRKICEFMAKQCDLFILIIGQRYGYVIEPEGISVAQFEYEVAHAENPHKILVYVKNNVEREPRLQEFLQKVQDFESGYFRSSFDTPEELYERIHIDVARWLVSQAKQKMLTQKQPSIGMSRSSFRSPADA